MSAPAVPQSVRISLRPGWHIPLDEVATEMARSGTDVDAIARELLRRFPGLPNNRYYLARATLMVERERERERDEEVRAREGDKWRIKKGMPAAHAGSPPQRRQVAPVVMAPGLVAFAEASGFTCAYCDRQGSERADPDGGAWAKDVVPRGLARDAGGLVLACGACKLAPNRHALLRDTASGNSW